jgi:hypothetical protein
MTATKPIQGTSALSSQQSPKRAVFFCSSCKFDPPSQSTKSSGDMGLQSTDRRRRYMRRGSKSPNMLATLLTLNLEKESTTDHDEADAYRSTKQERRISITSALRLNLEKSAIIDPKTTSSIRYFSIEQKGRYSLELLSNL